MQNCCRTRYSCVKYCCRTTSSPPIRTTSVLWCLTRYGFPTKQSPRYWFGLYVSCSIQIHAFLDIFPGLVQSHYSSSTVKAPTRITSSLKLDSESSNSYKVIARVWLSKLKLVQSHLPSLTVKAQTPTNPLLEFIVKTPTPKSSLSKLQLLQSHRPCSTVKAQTRDEVIARVQLSKLKLLQSHHSS